MSEIKPTLEQLSDPYVLQLIVALSKQHDRIELLEAKKKALWYRLVAALQQDGCSLEGSQVEADLTMDMANAAPGLVFNSDGSVSKTGIFPDSITNWIVPNKEEENG